MLYCGARPSLIPTGLGFDVGARCTNHRAPALFRSKMPARLLGKQQTASDQQSIRQSEQNPPRGFLPPCRRWHRTPTTAVGRVNHPHDQHAIQEQNQSRNDQPPPKSCFHVYAPFRFLLTKLYHAVLADASADRAIATPGGCLLSGSLSFSLYQEWLHPGAFVEDACTRESREMAPARPGLLRQLEDHPAVFRAAVGRVRHHDALFDERLRQRVSRAIWKTRIFIPPANPLQPHRCPQPR